MCHGRIAISASSPVLFCLTLAAPAHAEKRVALVIGNGFYQYQPILSNPKHDAEDVAKALGDLNFEVVLGLDLTRADMNEKLDEFSRKADGADIAFIYYSGHGEFGGFNYLLPNDASLNSAADVNPFRLVRIDTVMETLSGVKGPKIVVLDACRDNPVANELKRKLAALRGVKGAEVTRGLSPISSSSVSGLLVAYATQADETALDGKGRNSPFTAAFIKKYPIRTPIFAKCFSRDGQRDSRDGRQAATGDFGLAHRRVQAQDHHHASKAERNFTPGRSPQSPLGPERSRTRMGVRQGHYRTVLEDFIRHYGGTF